MASTTASKAHDPYKSFEFGKLLAFDPAKVARDFRLPRFDLESLIAIQRKNFEALTAANQRAVDGFQAIVRRQSEILREGMEETVAALKETMSAESPEAGAKSQAELARNAFERAVVNARELAELVAKSNSEALEILNRRIAESLEEFKTLGAKPAPSRPTPAATAE